MFEDMRIEEAGERRTADATVESAARTWGSTSIVKRARIKVWRIALPAIFLIGGALGLAFISTPTGKEHVPQPQAVAAPSSQPDVAAHIPVAGSALVAGLPFEVSAQVSNGGVAAAGKFRTLFEIDFNTDNFRNAEKAVFGSPIEALEAGASVSVRSEPILMHAAGRGTHAIRLCADVFGEVAESNEDNNCGPALVFEAR